MVIFNVNFFVGVGMYIYSILLFSICLGIAWYGKTTGWVWSRWVFVGGNYYLL